MGIAAIRPVIPALFLLACGEGGPSGAATETRPASTPSQAESAVRAELERYYEDFSQRDWPAFAEHFWPEATIATVWQPPGEPSAMVDVQTVPDFVANAPLGPGSKPIFEERMTSVDIRVVGNLAQAWARFHARFGDSGAVAEWDGIDGFTLLALDGRWRIVSLGFTDAQGEVTDRR
ncbi:MAG: DUF4440 domain-containing protein [Gemmatimonadales bacterium]